MNQCLASNSVCVFHSAVKAMNDRITSSKLERYNIDECVKIEDYNPGNMAIPEGRVGNVSNPFKAKLLLRIKKM
jgi:hypothetical protein